MLASVTYANGARLPATGGLPYDGAGRPSALEWGSPSGVVASHEVARSPDGRVADERVDGNDALPGPGFGLAGSENYLYDGAGRLTSAWLWGPGGATSRAYGFDDGPGCPNPMAGRASNRTTSSADGGEATSWCHDLAHRLVSAAGAGAPSSFSYGHRGSTVAMGAQSFSYDGAGLNVAASAEGGATVSYLRDTTGRVVSRTQPLPGGNTTVRYGHAGPGDAPAWAADASGTVTHRHLVALGGVLVTKGPAGESWDLPNLHGDVLATTDAAGAKVGPTRTYDPFGAPLAGLADNSPDDASYGWLGSHQRLHDHAPGIDITQMGARPYPPLPRPLPLRRPRGGGVVQRLRLRLRGSGQRVRSDRRMCAALAQEVSRSTGRAAAGCWRVGLRPPLRTPASGRYRGGDRRHTGNRRNLGRPRRDCRWAKESQRSRLIPVLVVGSGSQRQWASVLPVPPPGRSSPAPLRSRTMRGRSRRRQSPTESGAAFPPAASLATPSKFGADGFRGHRLMACNQCGGGFWHTVRCPVLESMLRTVFIVLVALLVGAGLLDLLGASIGLRVEIALPLVGGIGAAWLLVRRAVRRRAGSAS
ncbi:MAG: hypothetical protein AB1673_01880 [Actinomycetota bacterium]